MVQRPPTGTIPDAPGSYQFRDRDGRVIYVGKAKSLRSRLSNYFQNPAHLLPRTAQMVASAETVEWIQVRNDVEALMLEYSLIKQHKPRFNVRLRDDKSYPFLAITMGDEWPRAMVRRGSRDKGSRHFGPYAHAYAIRETLDSLLRTFPIRTCSDNKFNTHTKQGRPCLLFHIEKCTGPCINAIDHEPYTKLVDELVTFLDGDTAPVVKRLEAEMSEASHNLEFERAARLRDRLAAVRKAIEKQQMVTESAEDLDCFGMVEDELEAAVQVFYVRRGRVVGRKGLIVDKVEDLNRPQLLADILEQHYADAPLGVPPLVLVPEAPEDEDVLEDWLESQRGGAHPDGVAPLSPVPPAGPAGGGRLSFPGRGGLGRTRRPDAGHRARTPRRARPRWRGRGAPLGGGRRRMVGGQRQLPGGAQRESQRPQRRPGGDPGAPAR
jgi:excinuclease ABC subunit C